MCEEKQLLIVVHQPTQLVITTSLVSSNYHPCSQVIWKGVNVKPLNQYLRKLQIRRTENLQPVKLIYLGEKGSGKTTLNKSLITGKCNKARNSDLPKCDN